MRILLVTEAWEPQVNGVAVSYRHTVDEARRAGHEINIVSSDLASWRTLPAPFYPGIKLEWLAGKRVRGIIADFDPDCIHIATEGPLGWAARGACLRLRKPFTTSYHTCFPDYIAARSPRALRPALKTIACAVLRRFHAPSNAVMVATDSIEKDLRRRGFRRIARWSRGVDAALFTPAYGKDIETYRRLARPILLSVGRVAVEKNLESFLGPTTPGTKVVIGDGPDLAAMRRRFPAAVFLGAMQGEKLARHYAAADLFVFPSKTDTFGLVLLEAAASGLRIAAHPAAGPADIFAAPDTGTFAVLDDDLGKAMRAALSLTDAPAAARRFALGFSWTACTRQFLEHVQAPTPVAVCRIAFLPHAMRTRLLDLKARRWQFGGMLAVLYRCLTELGAPAIRLYLRRRLKAGREDARRFGERLGQPSQPRPVGFLIWCHAASVGEAASLLALIVKLRERYPAAAVMITTGTVTSARMLQSRLPQGVFHQYVPVDRLPYVRRFLDHWRPDLVVWVESELWPNLLDGVRRRRIPAILLNGRMSEKSFRQWRRVKGWAQEILGAFALCLTQTEAERERFTMLGARDARCIGNLKYAGHPLPCDEAALAALRAVAGQRAVWLMASTHGGEEEIAAAAHQQLQASHPGLLTIIAPRHAVRGDEVAALLAARGLKVARRSKDDIIDASTHVYLADTMGELGLLYRLAPLVVMGGSFASLGGHNPVEPAQLDCALIFGPSMFNFAEIAGEFLQRRAAMQVGQSSDLVAAIDRLLQNPVERDKLARNAKTLAADKRNVLDDIMKEMDPWLPAKPAGAA